MDALLTKCDACDGTGHIPNPSRGAGMVFSGPGAVNRPPVDLKTKCGLCHGEKMVLTEAGVAVMEVIQYLRKTGQY